MQLKKLVKGVQITRKEIKSKLNDEERMQSEELKATFRKNKDVKKKKKPKNCINKKHNLIGKEIINCNLKYFIRLV